MKLLNALLFTIIAIFSVSEHLQKNKKIPNPSVSAKIRDFSV